MCLCSYLLVNCEVKLQITTYLMPSNIQFSDSEKKTFISILFFVCSPNQDERLTLDHKTLFTLTGGELSHGVIDSH